MRDVLATCPDTLRAKYRKKAEKIGRSRASAIRLKCLECCCWHQAEVRRCQIKDCALWGLGGQRES